MKHNAASDQEKHKQQKQYNNIDNTAQINKSMRSV